MTVISVNSATRLAGTRARSGACWHCSPAQDPGSLHWGTWVDVDDADSVVKAAEAAGEKIVVAPMDVMTAGRMVALSDTPGGVVGAFRAFRAGTPCAKATSWVRSCL
jgi:predicted enzyme related to lactoylglutathione lyase